MQRPSLSSRLLFYKRARPATIAAATTPVKTGPVALVPSLVVVELH
jgi:hypothetical protein